MIKLAKHGPHNIDIISLLFGSLLGDTHGEMRTKNYSVRFSIKQSNNNVAHLAWRHKYLAERGYCSLRTLAVQGCASNPKKPTLKTIKGMSPTSLKVRQGHIGKKGRKYFYLRFHTFSYSSLLFLYNCFYGPDVPHGTSGTSGTSHNYENNLVTKDIISSSQEQTIQNEKNKKRIPSNDYLEQYLTPLALAV
jgi:hypothetical protein